MIHSVLLSTVKRAARMVIKAIAGIAVIVFIVANPIGNNSGIEFITSIIVLVACGVVWAIMEVFGGSDEVSEDTSPTRQ